MPICAVAAWCFDNPSAPKSGSKETESWEHLPFLLWAGYNNTTNTNNSNTNNDDDDDDDADDGSGGGDDDNNEGPAGRGRVGVPHGVRPFSYFVQISNKTLRCWTELWTKG